MNDNEGRGKIAEPAIYPNYLNTGVLNSFPDLGKNPHKAFSKSTKFYIMFY